MNKVLPLNLYRYTGLFRLMLLILTLGTWQLQAQDTTVPVITCKANQSKSLDANACTYTIQGTEFDPASVSDDSGTISSLTYTLSKVLPNPNLISEDFNTGSWNAANFEIGSPNGSVVSGAYRSGASDDRGTLRTVNQFVPTAGNPLVVSATLSYSSSNMIAFMGTRSTGLKVSGSSNEPSNSLYLRMHNFNNGQTDLSSTSYSGSPGAAFYSTPVRVKMVDNGSSVTVTLTNIATSAVLTTTQSSTYSSGSNYVVFSGGGGVSWDDIKISLGENEYLQVYQTGTSLSGVALDKGDTTITWAAKDAANNQASCTQVITVSDTQNPSLTVASNVSGTANSGIILNTTVSDAVFTDNCSGVQLSWVMTGATSASGSGQVGNRSYNPGVTTITYTAADSSGNTTTAATQVENTYQYYATGDGTALSPYQITSWEQLNNVRYNLSSYFILMNNLSSSSTGYSTYASSSANANLGWLPISQSSPYFSGSLDGNGFTISDLFISRGSQTYVGLFGYTSGATVKNIRLTNIDVTGLSRVGGLIGYAINTNVYKANVFGVVKSGGSNLYYGGLIGYLSNSSAYKVEQSSANVNVTSSRDNVGGLVGFSDSSSQILNCYSTGNVTGNRSVGGLIGRVASSTVVVSNSFSTGLVTGSLNKGGLIGSSSSTNITSCFWDTQTSTQATSAGGTGAAGKTTAQMKAQSSFTGWDFDTIWSITSNYNNGYPNMEGITDPVWVGTASSNWTDAANWADNLVPDNLSNVTISTSTPNAAVLNADYTVSSGKTLTINGSGSLSIAPNKVLTIAGTADFGGKSVTVKSDAAGTGSIGQITGTLSNATNVTVERYIAQGKRAYRFLASPVTTSDFISSNWQLATHITGSTIGANGFDTTVSGSPSMYTYNNQAASATGWTAVANTDATNLQAGMGYRILVRGDRTVDLTQASAANMNAAITLKATGTLKTGTVVIDAASTPVALNNTANATTNGFSLVGNPYAAAIDWQAVGKSAGLSTAYYGFDPNLGSGTTRGKYVAYDAAADVSSDAGSTAVTRYIKSGQAFFVNNTTLGTSETLTFSESNKATGSHAKMAPANNAVMSISVYDPNELALNSYPIDGTVAVFGGNFSNDLGYGDTIKLLSSGENLALSRSGATLAIEALAPVKSDDILNLKTIAFKANSNYTFKINGSNFGPEVKAYLKDAYLNTQKEIDLGADSFVAFKTNTEALSYGADRFSVVFAAVALANETFDKGSIAVYPNPVVGNQFSIQLPETLNGEVAVGLFDMLGQEVYAQKVNAESRIAVRPSTVLAKGIYMLSIENQGRTVNQKIIIN